MVQKKLFSKIILLFLALLALGGSFFIGVIFGYENRPGVEKVTNVIQKEPPIQFKEVDFNLFWDVWTRLEDKYVDKESIDRQKMVYGAISGLVRSLKDPYSEFLDPETSKQFNDDIRGSFDGIGAEIGIRRGLLTVISPLKASPAERAGLRAGDKIFKVGDKETYNLTLDEAVRLIRGKKGTSVTLTIFRDSLDTSEEITITRDTIRVDAVATETKSSSAGASDGKTAEKKPNNKIFVITLSHFSQSAAFEFRKAVQEFYRTDSKKLILDLRNNPGGFLQVAVDIASWFLPPGEVVARERFGDGREELYRSSGYRLFENVPTVILVNEGSASASEIVAGALRDLKGIKLVGKKTFGKGSVQEVEPLPKDASLKLTIAKWLTPKGEEIDGKGLEPDVVVELPEKKEIEEKEKNEKDLIMEKGIEVLREL